MTHLEIMWHRREQYKTGISLLLCHTEASVPLELSPRN